MSNAFRVLGVLSLCLGGLMFSGCAQPTVLPSQKHAPSSASAVKIYQKQPMKYEDLGMISLVITPDISWDEKGNTNKAFDMLKDKAAALGANGVLLDMPKDHYDLLASTGYNGTRYDVAMKMKPEKTAMAHAIFVVEEK